MLEGKKVIVFDLEIKKRIEECSRGWESHEEMGVSCLCLYDYESGRYRVFDDHNMIEALNILYKGELVVGFNTVNFDWRVLDKTYKKKEVRGSRDFDILREIWKSLGLDPGRFDYRTHGGYSLEMVANDTIGMRKSGNGAHAPELYQAGRWAELVDYCLEDVRIEKSLFEFIYQNGYVLRNGNKVEVKVDY